ncbi:MAG TPA: glutamine-hydrolyzing GMP synthase [Thermoanaerobaculia bacterium]|nr:glutamine-hydrolyzing GMP synthase [Thermoanaerobaculia bacterium]HXK66902.1 glutamine-hydrolyzing GMP synthase [Thermoanaerobaculia bacterium]
MTLMIAILDFGSQYTQLIARSIRELGTFSKVFPFHEPLKNVLDEKPCGIILSGGPRSVYDKGAPMIGREILDLGIPVLGICYGQQITCLLLGGKVASSQNREYGRMEIEILDEHPLFKGSPDHQTVWMSHGDKVESLPEGFKIIARTPSTPFAAIANDSRRMFGVQFHPEVRHTEHGRTILKNFLKICGAKKNWDMGSYRKQQVEMIREQVGSSNVISGLSGGVDSTVASSLVAEAIGSQLTCVFVDTGMLRKNEVSEVVNYFKDHHHLNVRVADAADLFLSRLEKRAIDPRRKRKIIGHTFIEVFEKEAGTLPDVKYLVQGTLYPDVIESISVWGPSSTIKLHHNVGGLPKKLNLKLIEPLRFLFKDEVRTLGRTLDIPDSIIMRHPFPGPGLAVRILGRVTAERVAILQEADAIYMEELRTSGWYKKTAQAFAVLLPVKSVGVMGDEGTYEHVCALRAVTTEDFMTADFAALPHDLLGRISRRIVNEVRGINRVVYDVTTKPPATIEWE